MIQRLCMLVLLLAACAATTQAAEQPAWPKPWLGVHVMVGGDGPINDLIGQTPKLAAMGVNTLIVEVNYGFDYRSHPELGSRTAITRPVAARLAEACRNHKIRLIPQFNCLGHQSWAANTLPLLTKHPEFDETPGQYPANKGIYCRSWCPLHPGVNPIIFDLMDELIDAFSADAFHVGMDEVFLIGSEHCARCKGKDKGGLFARAVNDYHAHLVGKRKVEMFMWPDRLLDAAITGDSEWEASKNGTHKAIDGIPKDIVMCDWHYGVTGIDPGWPRVRSHSPLGRMDARAHSLGTAPRPAADLVTGALGRSHGCVLPCLLPGRLSG